MAMSSLTENILQELREATGASGKPTTEEQA